MAKLTHEEAVARIEAKHGEKITVLGQYKNGKSRLAVQCEYGHQWAPLAMSLFVGHGCAVCGRKLANEARRLTHAEFVDRINKKFDEEIIVLGEYRDSESPVLVRGGCGHQWGMAPTRMRDCPKCAVQQAIKDKTLTHGEVVARIEKHLGEKVIILGQYKGHNEPLLVRCNCGYEWAPSAASLLQGRGCSKCGHKRRSLKWRVTHEEFIKRIKEHFGSTITIIGRYESAKSRIGALCQCGHQWRPLAGQLLYGHGCFKCGRKTAGDKKRLNEAEALARIEKNFSGTITVLGRYKGGQSKLPVRCQCGHQWAPTAAFLLAGRGCKKCGLERGGQARRLTHDEVIKRIEELFGPKIKVIGRYETMAHGLDVFCECGHQWKANVDCLSRGQGCKKCASEKNGQECRLTHTKAMAKIHAKFGDQITVLSQYKTSKDKLTVSGKCGHQWEARLSGILKGIGYCPECAPKQSWESRRITHDEAVERINKNFKGKITVVGQFQGSHNPLDVRCECGYQWSPGAISLFTGHGCIRCAHNKLSEERALSHAEAVARIEKQSNGTITVLGQYKNQNTKLNVRCQCGHQWSPVAVSLFSSGCPKCAPYGFQFDKPGIAYYLRVATSSGPLYKIGITNRTVAERFRKDINRITILKIWTFTIGAKAYEFEQQVLRENAFDQYRGPAILESGNDELFVCDVLGLDVEQPQLDLAFAA